MTDTKYPPIVISLVNRAETNWTLEGTEKEPVRMAWPGLYRISPTSKVRVDLPAEQGGGYRYDNIRHILGCDFIDPARQDKEGYKPDIQQDNIWLQNGTGTFVREGAGIGTYDYLKSYQGNKNNPMRPPEAEVEFEEVIAVEVARSKNVSFDKKADAYMILREIRWQEPGSDEFQYNEEKLGLMSALFGLASFDSPEEKFNELYRIADARPEMIVDSIANSKKKLFATIKKAEELAVLTFADDRVYLTESKTVLLTYKGRVAKNNQINKLADFLGSEDGSLFYSQLNSLIEAAGEKSLKRVLSNQIS